MGHHFVKQVLVNCAGDSEGGKSSWGSLTR